jgi:tetratricopeptide (TPR) repeat protein
MSLLIANSRDGDSVGPEPLAVPPLFAGPLRDDLIARIDAALTSGDHQTVTVLLQESETNFADDPAFPALHVRCLKLAQRKMHLDSALRDALHELDADRFVASLGKFREALSLSSGHELLKRSVCDVAIASADTVSRDHWRVAEALLCEVNVTDAEQDVLTPIWLRIDRHKREEAIRTALDESGRAEHSEYLPHLRKRLADLCCMYPGNDHLESRTHMLDKLLTQRVAEERDKNLRRLLLFRERVNLTENPQTLRRFQELVAPFVSPYAGDPAFLAVLEDIRVVQSSYENAARCISENNLHEALQICDRVLQNRPANVLFRALEEKAKSRQWVTRLADATVQRAQSFEQRAQYVEALEEWQSLREIEPRYPSLPSELLHCAALKHYSELLRSPQQPSIDENALTPEILIEQPEPNLSVSFFDSSQPGACSRRLRIAMTEDAWNHLKTGLAATAALLLLVLVLVTNSHR